MFLIMDKTSTLTLCMYKLKAAYGNFQQTIFTLVSVDIYTCIYVFAVSFQESMWTWGWGMNYCINLVRNWNLQV